MKKLSILIAAVALVCFTVPAMAVDWNFYGSSRMETYWSSRDFKDNENSAGTDDKDSDLIWDLQGNSRLGANVKADHLKGQIELGLGEDQGGDKDVTTRRVYGTWNFGAGSLKIGKDYTPVSYFVSGQVGRGDAGLIGFGAPYAVRPGQAALTLGGFDVALITPKTDRDLEDEAGNTLDGDVDTVFPKIEASYGMSLDAFSFRVFGGYQYYSIEEVESAVNPGDTNDIDVTSYIIGGGGLFNFGPAYVGAQIMYGQNMGNANWSGGAFDNAGWDGDDDTNDVNTLGGILIAGMKVSDMWSFEAGIGYIVDDPKDADDNDEKTEAMDVYVQSVITMAPGVYIIPNINFASYGNNPENDDQGSDWVAGAKWQIDF